MSASMDPDLQECLEKALREWLAESGGGFITASLLVVDFADSDGEQKWVWSCSDGQHMQTSMGLSAWLQGLLSFEQHRFLEESETR